MEDTGDARVDSCTFDRNAVALELVQVTCMYIVASLVVTHVVCHTQKDGPLSFADNRLFDNAVGVLVHSVRDTIWACRHITCLCRDLPQRRC
jgi:hypothetical protein